MKKHYLLTKLRSSGDGIITLRNGDSLLATTDFSNSYIRRFRRPNMASIIDKGDILVFSWGDPGYKVITPATVVNFTPLATVLNNEAPDL